MIRSDKRLRICLALIILNLCFIWGNSLLPGEMSGALSDWVKDLLSRLIPGDEMPSSGGGLLRKIAHFTEFAALGLLLSRFFGLLKKHRGLAFLCGGLTACIDETIQIFVPDRGPGILDVGIDICGVLAGMMLLQIGNELWKKKQS